MDSYIVNVIIHVIIKIEESDLMINERLKQARIMQNLKQSELADLLNVKNTTISNWEIGVSNPDVNIIQELCNALHISVNYLFDGRNETLTQEEATLLKRYKKLDDYGKKAVDTTLNLEFQRVFSSLEDVQFDTFESAYFYLTKNPMYAMGGLDIESMNKDELIKFANDQYEMDQRALKLFK